MKRLLSLILAVFMLISLVPANSFAESNVDDAIVPETVEDESVQTVVEESENNPQEIDIIVESSEKTEEKSEDDAPEESGEAEPLSEESEKAETLSEESEEAENITLMKNSSSELENIGECIGFVRVTVENTTFSMTNGAAWDGILIDTPVNLYTGSTMMSCVIDALGDISQTGAESNYITEINGLNAGDGGYMSGWMGTLNDWFTNEGFDSFTVSAGTLQNGDEICILYTCDFGPDCGGDWSNNDKTLAALSFGAGELCPAFDSSIHEYTLIVPSGTTGITVLPVAANKNFQVHTFVGETEYKRCAAVPISDGSVISIIDGDPLWPSMNGGDYGEADSVPAEEYNVTVVYEKLSKCLCPRTDSRSIYIRNRFRCQCKLVGSGAFRLHRQRQRCFRLGRLSGGS